MRGYTAGLGPVVPREKVKWPAWTLLCGHILQLLHCYTSRHTRHHGPLCYKADLLLREQAELTQSALVETGRHETTTIGADAALPQPRQLLYNHARPPVSPKERSAHMHPTALLRAPQSLPSEIKMAGD